MGGRQRRQRSSAVVCFARHAHLASPLFLPPSPCPAFTRYTADEKERAAAFAAYREGVPAALASRFPVLDECFVLQYVPGGGGGGGEAAAARPTASLSARFAGKPVLDEERRGSGAFEYARELPLFLSRIAGTYAAPAGAGGAGAGAGAGAAAAAVAAAVGSGMRTVLVMGEESSVVESVLPPVAAEVDPWMAQDSDDEE